MLSDFLIPFTAIGLAELGDKTQLAVLLLATRTTKHAALAAGVMTAFVAVDGLAVILGSAAGMLIPLNVIRILAGILFIIFGMVMLRGESEAEEEKEIGMKSPFITGFMVILISEMGDKTQIAAGLFAAKYSPVAVFAGTIAALAVLSVLAIWAGGFLSKKINQKLLSRIAGILFVTIGAVMLIAG